MKYKIGEVAKMIGLSIPTLRFYDHEGLLPFVNRTENGIRVFTEEDLKSINLVNCIKGSGATIKEIKHYMDLCQIGDSTLNERLNFFIGKKENVLNQLQELQNVLSTIEHKIDYYQIAINAGTEEVHKLKKKDN